MKARSLELLHYQHNREATVDEMITDNEDKRRNCVNSSEKTHRLYGGRLKS